MRVIALAVATIAIIVVGLSIREYLCRCVPSRSKKRIVSYVAQALSV
jgi:hypothetical protein